MADSDRYKGALKDDAPAEIAEALRALVGPDAVVRLYLKADCAKDGTFGRTDLVLTDTHFVALPEGEDGIATALSDIKGAYVLPVVGGRFVVWELEDGSSHKVGLSESLWAEAAELTRAIHQVRDGHPIALQEVDRKNCDQCGRRLPEIDSICPKCVKWRVIFWRIAAYLKPYWPKAAFLTLLAAISTATSLLPPLLTKKMIDEVLVPVDEFGNQGPDQRFRGLLWVVFLQMLLHVGGWGLQFLHKRTSSWLGARITLDIRNKMYGHMLRLPVRYHDRKELGVLMARVSNDAGALNDFLISGIPDLLLNFLSFWGILYISLTLSPKLTAIVLIPVPFMWAWSAMTKKKMYPHHLRSWMVESRYWGKLWEIFFGIRAVKAFNQENKEVKAFAERSDKVHALHLEVNRLNSRLGAFGGFIGFGATLALYLVGGADVIHGVMTIGALMAFQAYMGQLYGPLLWFADLGGWLHKAFTGAARIFEILDTREEGLVAEEPGPVKRIEGHVQFKDVCFGYDPTKLVLDHVNLDVPAGETVGVVGRSGAGKTTAINLLCRFYDPSEGAILVDGKDLRDYPPGALRSQIGIVLQDAFLFSGTISDNIRYANKKATFAQVIDAAKVANAHNFITNMGDGYDTEAGERGCHLSGGEKQRIGIARAVIRDPRILILDEATASLDSVTERSIQQAMIELRKGRTTFIIAHRLATLRGADKIIVFDQGKICEMGPWPELMAKKGALWDMVQAQKAIEAEALD